MPSLVDPTASPPNDVECGPQPDSPNRSPSKIDSMKKSVSELHMGFNATHKRIIHGDRLEFWEHHASELDNEGTTDIFSQNDSLLAKDSGFADVKKIIYPYKYFAASLTLLSFASNVYSIVSEDWYVLVNETNSNDSNKFLVTKAIAERFMEKEADMHRLVPGLELVCLVVTVASIFRQLMSAIIYPHCVRADTEELKHQASFMRWNYIAQAFLAHLPWVATFSSMKMLYYVTPIVLSTDAYNLGVRIKEKLDMSTDEGRNAYERLCDKMTAAGSVAWFLSSRLVGLMIGFDAFLVKFRIAETYVNYDEATPQAVLYCFVFLFQVLSIVNLNRFVRDRLFLFLFAGEDGVLSEAEAARKDVWCALLTRQIWSHYGCFKFMVVMLSFDDYDYQLLVLDPSKKPGNDTAVEAGSSYQMLQQEATSRPSISPRTEDKRTMCTKCGEKMA